jgi:uncharacterized membrane protein YciS (DUF1049 family)
MLIQGQFRLSSLLVFFSKYVMEPMDTVLKVYLNIDESAKVLSPVKLTLIKTKTQFFLSDQIVVIFRHGLVISFSGNELIREVHYSSTNLFL